MSDADRATEEADRIVAAALQAQCDHPMGVNHVCQVCGLVLPGQDDPSL
jgi:hypothetical protein